MEQPLRPLDASLPTVFLLPGSCYCAVVPTVVSTVLGSCVAVCLWDRRRGVAAMNHFVLPQYASGGQELRYGDRSIDHIVGEMEHYHCAASALEAKLFGGAEVLSWGGPDRSIGAKNVEIALARLESYRIPVTARHTGGQVGVSIKFFTGTGDVFVRRVQP